MSKIPVVKFEEKHHVLEVDGVRYNIPQRTAALEKLIRERDAKINEMTEYESNMRLLEILFGEDKAKQMFPDGEQTNLDKLEKCTKSAIALYMKEHINLQTKNILSELFGTQEPSSKKRK